MLTCLPAPRRQVTRGRRVRVTRQLKAKLIWRMLLNWQTSCSQLAALCQQCKFTPRCSSTKTSKKSRDIQCLSATLPLASYMAPAEFLTPAQNLRLNAKQQKCLVMTLPDVCIFTTNCKCLRLCSMAVECHSTTCHFIAILHHVCTSTLHCCDSHHHHSSGNEGLFIH